MSSTNVLIVGSGAVGCFYGSRLHSLAKNTLVSLVCRSNYKAVKSNGVTLRTHSFGDYHFSPSGVYDSVAAAKAANVPWHYVVVTTKALPDISDDSALVEPVVGKDTSIVLIQNGVGVEAPYRARYPKTPILSGVTVVSAEQVEPGVVVQNRWTRLSLGPYAGDGAAELVKKGEERNADFAQRLTDGGIKDVETYDEQGLQLVRWHKLVINAAMNPSAVLSGGTGNSRMSLDPELRIHLQGCMDEIFEAVPRIVGRSFTEKMAKPDRILKSTERNTEGIPSMLIDWRKKAPLEIEVILGEPVREARRKGVELPRLQTMYALLKMAQTRRKEDAEKAKL